jgi:predicted transcriptional regulator
MVHALISIHPEYVAKIVGGNKTVEIRTRKMTLTVGATLWIYATRPIGEIRAVARIKEICYISPTKAWGDFEDVLGITKSAFQTYVNGSRFISAVTLSAVTQLRAPLSLMSIQKSVRGFHPPQFFKHLHKGDPLYALLSKSYPARFR